MTEKNLNYFETLNKVNVTAHIEKKGGFNYLSWPFAVAELRKNHPDATWEVKRFNNLPYMQTPMGYFVEVEVIVNGIPMSQIHPVLDNRNQVIKEPNVFHINTSIQRCLVKAIALHGLGLYIYAGEDLPMDEEPQETLKKPVYNAPAPQQAQSPKSNKEVVKQQLEKVSQINQLEQNGEVLSEEKIRELFGDDIEVVMADEVITENELKRITQKIYGCKPKEGKHYGTIYGWIGDAAGIQVKTKNDLPKIPADRFNAVAAVLDSKANHFESVAS